MQVQQASTQSQVKKITKHLENVVVAIENKEDSDALPRARELLAEGLHVLGGWPLLTTRPKNKHAEHAAIILQDIVFLVMPSLFLV
jgi:hypothetical protein